MRSIPAILLVTFILANGVMAEYVEAKPGQEEACNDQPVRSFKCGGCSKIIIKMYRDFEAQKGKYEVFCTTCNNSKTPVSGPVISVISLAEASVDPNFKVNVDMTSRCTSRLLALTVSAIAVFVAVLN